MCLLVIEGKDKLAKNGSLDCVCLNNPVSFLLPFVRSFRTQLIPPQPTVKTMPGKSA